MAVDRTSLITRYPEFTDTTATLVTACIADAELMIDSDVYGNKYDMAVTDLAAHYIAINPLGEMARISAKKPDTVYSLKYKDILASVAAGCRVI